MPRSAPRPSFGARSAAVAALWLGSACAAPVTPPRATAAPLGLDAASSQRVERHVPVVEQMARKHGVDPALVSAVIWVESRFRADARSPAGATGLMQLMPATARALARRLDRRPRPKDPSFNVDAGTLYLARMLTRFDGDVALALAGYHAGPGNARRYQAQGRIPASIQRYIDAVLDARARFALLWPARRLARR